MNLLTRNKKFRGGIPKHLLSVLWTYIDPNTEWTKLNYPSANLPSPYESKRVAVIQIAHLVFCGSTTSCYVKQCERYLHYSRVFPILKWREMGA